MNTILILFFFYMIPRFKPIVGLREFKACFPTKSKDDIARFETTFARLVGQKFGISFPYGRTGLFLLLKALGLKKKEIICPAYTCIVVPHAISFSNNIPVFVDSEPHGFNMDLDKVESKISPKTGAIIATSLFGYPVDLDKLELIRLKYPHVKIIQDCAHSFAAYWKGRSVQKEGIAALFGFNISKIITSVFGGMVTTDNEDLAINLKALRKKTLYTASLWKSISRFVYFISLYLTFRESIYSLINRFEQKGFLDKFTKYYDEDKIDMPKDYLTDLTKFEARIGLSNILRYNDIISKRIEAAEYYFNYLKNQPDIKLPPKTLGATYSHFVIQVNNRMEWLYKGLKNNIQLGWLIEYCIPMMNAYRKDDSKKFPISFELSKTTINLPVWGGEKLSKRVVHKLFEQH